jgi:hypothetical protein
LLLDSVRHAQSRNVQPQTASAELLLDSAFPTYSILPFPPSTDSKSLIYEVRDVQVWGLKADELYGRISMPIKILIKTREMSTENQLCQQILLLLPRGGSWVMLRITAANGTG